MKHGEEACPYLFRGKKRGPCEGGRGGEDCDPSLLHSTKVLEFHEPQAHKALRVCCEGTEQELGLAGAHL